MESLYFKSTKEIRKEKLSLEKELKVSISIVGRKVSFEGPAINEYEAQIVLEAVQFGFSAKKALSLLNDDIVFRKVTIKNYTRRKDLKEVRGRIIGKEGKTKRAIENIAGCEIQVNDNEIGFICPADDVEETTTAITNLIRGTKQANVYRFLEKMNANRKITKNEDLGLKLTKKDSS